MNRRRERGPAAISLWAAALVSLALGLGGCTVGPDYETPQIETGEGWSEPVSEPVSKPASEQASEGVEVDLDGWWQSFGDPTLDRLVLRAVEQSLDLREAAARVAEARALRDRAAGGRYPTVGAQGSVTQRAQSENGALPINRIPDLDREQTLYDVGFDAGWEIDLFGRNRRSVEAAQARFQEAVEQRREVRLTVAAEVARTYFDLRGAQRRLAARRSAVEAVRGTAELVLLQAQAGEVPDARRVQVEADLAGLEAQLPGLEGEIRASALSLGVLLGSLPETELELVDTEPPTLRLAPIPVGERAALLRRRPDVRAAERELAGATAQIGVATADLFPRLSIGAGGGFQAMDPADLTRSESGRWSLVPFLSWRIFDGGRVRAEIRATEARTEAAAVRYEKAVLGALAEAERALTRYHRGLEALERQDVAVDAARRNRELANLRYEAGDSTLLELLDAARGLASAELVRADLQTRAAIQLVALYKALGGGWSEEPADAGRGEDPPGATALGR